MIIRENEYFEWQMDVSKEEYIKIQKYIQMRNNAENFLAKHCKAHYGNKSSLTRYSSHNGWTQSSKIINDLTRDSIGNKITCHTLELANLQKDVLKILNKKNDRGFIYESELLYCFAYPQYPNILTEQFESEQEIIIPKPKPYNYIPIIIVISIVIACVALSAYLESLLNIK